MPDLILDPRFWPHLALGLLFTVLLATVVLYRQSRKLSLRSGVIAAVEQLGDGVIVLDCNRRIVECNAAFARILDEDERRLVGLSAQDLGPILRERFKNLDAWPSAEQCLHEPARIDVATNESDSRTFEMTFWPLRDASHQVVGQSVVLRDVTQQREAIEDLEALHETALAIANAGDLGATLKMIVDAVSRLASADAARIALLERLGDTFQVTADVDADAADGESLISTSRPCGAVTREIALDGRPRYVPDVDGSKARRSLYMSERVKAYAGLPLMSGDRCLGLLYVTYDRLFFFSDADRRLLESLSSHAAVAISNAQLLAETRRAATTDPLTGLPNHRYLMDRLDAEMARAKRHDHPLTILMIDVDDFKLVNDAHGHTVGDDVLRLIARVLRETLRESDVVGRYGGDEFLVLLPESAGEEAATAAERLTQAMQAQQFRVPRHPSAETTDGSGASADGAGSAASAAIPLRLSIGLATFPTDASSRLELISLADAAMYAAKRGGNGGTISAEMTSAGFLAAQNATFGVLEGLVNSVDAKDRYTRLHSEQVAHYALALGTELGLDSETTRTLRIAGLLHDVGKIGIPDHILRKPGRLDAIERTMIEQHPVLGDLIIREVPQLTDVLDAVRHHHERWDGGGYPGGLKGEDIPNVARLVAVADAFSAMILDRPYRRALSVDEALAQLRDGAGAQFDPAMVERFAAVVERENERESEREAVPP